MVYHIIMLVLVFIAVIIMTGGGYGVGSYRNVSWNWNDHYKTMVQAARAYNVSFQPRTLQTESTLQQEENFYRNLNFTISLMPCSLNLNSAY